MDRAAYIAMNAAAEALRAQAATAHNLANIGTSGFKALLTQTEAVSVEGAGWNSRVNGRLVPQGWDARGGAVQTTGRVLDVALAEDRWLAVQAGDGTTAYTRNGALQLTSNGQLLDAEGRPVLGDGGPVSLPPHSDLMVGADGTLSLTPLGSTANVRAQVGRLQVVSATPGQIDRREDGLFAPRDGQALAPAAGPVLVSGALESANVNAAEQMVALIEHSRRFELAVDTLKRADAYAESAQSLMRLR